MAEEYDQLEDEWYPHLFRQLERVVRAHPPAGSGMTALDVGCGTGLQTLALAAMGYAATGIDISEGQLAQARKKAEAGSLVAHFVQGSALQLPFGDASFDVVTCCGSVLGFVPDYPRALSEIARVLKPAGTLILEVDHRWNLDLLWALVDPLLGGRLGFEQPAAESWKNLSRSPRSSIVQEYPFTRLDGSVEKMRVRLFTRHEILRTCREVGLHPRATHAVHAVTNLMPSTWLSHPGLARPWRKLARALTRFDERLASRFPFRMLANNLILVLERGESR